MKSSFFTVSTQTYELHSGMSSAFFFSNLVLKPVFTTSPSIGSEGISPNDASTSKLIALSAHLSQCLRRGGSPSAFLQMFFVLNLKHHLPSQVKQVPSAGDIKIYLPISGDSDHLVLERVVSGVDSWCKTNGMSLSTQKCVVLKQSMTDYGYHTDGVQIPSANVANFHLLVSASLRHRTSPVKSTEQINELHI